MIDQTLGHYRIVEKIGAGGMGVVYRAHDERLDRDMALKVLPAGALADEAARKRFRKEALALAKLSHSNIGAIHDFDTQDGVDFLVMEYIGGGTLANRLAGGALREKEVAALGAQIAAALAEAHEQGIVHRDLKPGNIAVTAKEQVKVLDFGLAKLLQPAGGGVPGESATESVTAAQVVGTLPYMAPEQVEGERLDARTDIYGLGVVLYEMATGVRPFRADSALRLRDVILHQPPVLPSRLNPQVSPALEGIILKCLEKDPENRYQSAKEAGVDLRRLGAPSTAPAGRAAAPARASWRWPVLTGIGVVLAAGIAIGLNVGGWRERLLPGSRPGRIESLAVLPLENLSADPSQSYLADGMTEELITDLGQISALRVISRTSVTHYKGTRKTIPEIARELHVDAVVEGSVERAGDQVRITAQLIEAPTDRHLWARSYQREFRNALQLQDEVAQAIAREIQVKLTPQEQTRLASSRPVNPEAYNDYLKGRYFYNQRTPESYRKANEYFQQAVDKDPNYAPAWALWADTAWDPALSLAENAERAHKGLQKALQLDDSLAEVHTVIGGEKMDSEWDWAGAEREIRRAIELNPNYAEAHHFYSHYLMAQGRVEESLRESQRAMESDPLNLAMGAHLAWHYLFARQYDQAMAQCRRTLDLDPNYQLAHVFLAQAEEQKGEYAHAVAEFQKVLALADGNPRPSRGWAPLGPLAGLGHAYALAGNKAEALSTIKRLLQIDKGPMGPYRLAIVYLGLGDKERSLAFLKKAVDAHAVPVFDPPNKDPIFDSLHSDPRFQDLLRRIGLP